MQKALNIIFKYSIYALIFLLPLFWLPFTVEGHEFNKQYLFIVLATIAGLAWLARQVVVRQKISLRRIPLNIWVIVSLTTVILSGIFSLNSISSWLGFYGRFSGAIVSLIAACLLYFLVANGVASSTGLPRRPSTSLGAPRNDTIMRLIVLSGWVVVVSAWCAVLGVFERFISQDGILRVMSLRSFNLTSGSIEGLAIYLAVLVSVLMGVLLRSNPERVKRVEGLTHILISFSHIALFVSAVILLVLINVSSAWLVLGITMLLLLAAALWTGAFRRRVNVLAAPMLLVLLAGFGLSGFMPSLNNLPREISLTQRASWDIAQQSFKANKENLLFGAGPGTFFTDFVQYKPVGINQTSVWNIRFDRPSSHALEMLAASGVVGLGGQTLLVLVFVLMLFLALKGFKKAPLDSARGLWLFWPLLLGWLAVFTAQFVYTQNTVLLFYFWLFTALLAGLWWRQRPERSRRERSRREFSFKKMPEVGLVANVVLLVLVVVAGALFYLGGRFYWADVVFARTFSPSAGTTSGLEDVVGLNGYRENYRRALSQSYLTDAWQEASKAEEERNLPALQALISGAIGQAQKAIQLDGNNVAAWENLGIIYRDSRGLVGGAVPFSLAAFARASELEPTNPVFFRERCWLNLINEERDWEETISYCQKAVELKPDYLDAHFQLALAFEGKGDLGRALVQMESTLNNIKGVSFQRGSALASAASEIYFQIGRLSFNLDQNEKAVRMFEQSIVVNPNYANAHYALGLALRAQGSFAEALASLRIVNQLVPGNEVILGLIGELNAALAPPAEDEITESEE